MLGHGFKTLWLHDDNNKEIKTVFYRVKVKFTCSLLYTQALNKALM